MHLERLLHVMTLGGIMLAGCSHDDEARDRPVEIIDLSDLLMMPDAFVDMIVAPDLADKSSWVVM